MDEMKGMGPFIPSSPSMAPLSPHREFDRTLTVDIQIGSWLRIPLGFSATRGDNF